MNTLCSWHRDIYFLWFQFSFFSCAYLINFDTLMNVPYALCLCPYALKDFILGQLDRVKLGHNTFSEDAIELIVRSSEGILRKARNLCLGCLLEAVRRQEKQIGLENVNRVLIQPHWRKEDDLAHF